MTRDDVELVALVLHETAHNTLWVPGAASFNESFAQYAGYRAAERFYRARGDSAAAQRAGDRWHDEMVLADYYDALVTRLERFYDTAPDSAAVDSGRAALGAWAELQLHGPVAAQLRTLRPEWIQARPINNARLVGIRLYRTGLDLFEAWHRRHDGDVARAVAALAELMTGVEGDEAAFDRLRTALGRVASGPEPGRLEGRAAPDP
jgi:predicted aminopeptidase